MSIPPNFVPPIPPRFAVRAALAVRAKLLRLADRIIPPYARAIELAFGYETTLFLRAVCRFRIADILASGPATAAELARRLNVDADALHRTLRALVAHGVFELDEEGRFHNNRVSETLKVGVSGSMHAWAMFSGSKSNLEAWADYERTLETGKNAFERVHGKDCWAYFAEHPEEGQTFNQAMVDLTDLQAPAIAASYSFGDYATICDVAGGRGTLLAAILNKHPGVRGWLVDAPQVLDHAGAFLASRGVAERVDRKPGNMFLDVPAGADAYILKDILHDWDDARSIKILENIRRATAPGKKVLLVEIVVEPNEISTPGPMIDAHMMIATCDGRQRSVAEFRRLFEKSGFRFQRVVETPMPASVVEGVAI